MKKFIIIISLMIILLAGSIFTTACKPAEFTIPEETTELTEISEEEITNDEETEEEKDVNVEGKKYTLTKRVYAEDYEGRMTEEELQTAIEEHPVILEFGKDTVKVSSDNYNLEEDKYFQDTRECAYTVSGNTVVVTMTGDGIPPFEETYTANGDTLVKEDMYVETYTLQ